MVHAPVGSASPTTGRFAARPVRSAKAIVINGVQILKSAQSADNPVPKSVPILKSFLAGRLDAAAGRFLYYENSIMFRTPRITTTTHTTRKSLKRSGSVGRSVS